MARTLIGLVAAATALLAPASPAAALGRGSYDAAPRAELTLTYLAEAGFASAVKLTCDPDGGGHPKPAEACAVLQKAGADPGRLPHGDGMCTLLYQPVTAEIKGVWRGRDVQWRHTYGNTCEMNRATGVLFQF